MSERWLINEYEDGTWGNTDEYSSREEALEAAEDFCDAFDVDECFIGQAVPVKASDYINVQKLWERIEEDAYTYDLETDQDIFNCFNLFKFQQDLTKVIDEHLVSSCFRIINIEKFKRIM